MVRVFHSSGDYHRSQEGSRVNGLSFLAERYSKIARNLYVWEVSSLRWTERANRRVGCDLERVYKSLSIWWECERKL